jgi:hypothetical protein
VQLSSERADSCKENEFFLMYGISQIANLALTMRPYNLPCLRPFLPAGNGDSRTTLRRMLMKSMLARSFALSLTAASLALFLAGSSRAAIIISEVDASGSSATSNTYNADWFELTNTGASVQDITGWKMDDNSHSPAAAVALRGVTSIAPGQSVVFVEGLADGSTDGTIDTNFENFWFGAGNVPAGFIIGNYGGTGVGLSQTTDEVNIFDAASPTPNLVTGVEFNASMVGVSFDNAAGIGGSTIGSEPTISTLSVVGTNGAFSSFNAATGQPNEIGSPGTIVSAPEPASLVLAGMGLMTFGFIACRRRPTA